MKQSSFSLKSISPIDGRYSNELEVLRDYFSEYAYIKYRILVEIRFVFSLSEIKIIRKINKYEKRELNNIFINFDLKDAERVKKIEDKTNHDVKAIEYFLKDKLNKTSLRDVASYIHFGLTSEDVNNIATRLMIKDANENILIKELKNLNLLIFNEYKKYKNLPMIARTHGQPAVPTTLGKEFLVFSKRLENEIKILEKHNFSAKINGAVGNYNVMHFAYPKLNWKKFSKNFLNKLGLKTNLYTTQIAPYEDIIKYFQTVQRVNGIILDLNQDMWRYISDGYFFQKNNKNEIGSSTMPQKINPINFENSEGNIVIANSLINGFTNKLPISRLQRDLSGSTISRNFGVALSHSLLAYKSSSKGLIRLSANKDKISDDLNSDWSILTEAVQIYLKKEGIDQGYEIIKKQTRGKKLLKEDYQKLIINLPINNRQKKVLLNLSPEKYTGLL